MITHTSEMITHTSDSTFRYYKVVGEPNQGIWGWGDPAAICSILGGFSCWLTGAGAGGNCPRTGVQGCHSPLLHPKPTPCPGLYGTLSAHS